MGLSIYLHFGISVPNKVGESSTAIIVFGVNLIVRLETLMRQMFQFECLIDDPCFRVG